MKRLFLISIMLAMSIGFSPVIAYNNFQKLSVSYSKTNNNYWLVLYAINPKYLTNDFDPKIDGFDVKVALKDGSSRMIPSRNVGIIQLGKMMYKKAEQYTYFCFVLVIDNSGSIDDANLNLVQDTLSKFVKRLPVSFEGMAILFSDEVKVNPFVKDKKDLEQQIREPYNRGGTALYDAMGRAVDELKYTNDTVPLKFVVVFTDGNENSSARFTDREEFRNYIVSEATQAHIPMFVIGVTDEVDEALLKDVAKFGLYQPVTAIPNIDKAFDAINEVINAAYLIKIPAVSTLADIKCFYLMGRDGINNRNSYTVQDVCP